MRARAGDVLPREAAVEAGAAAQPAGDPQAAPAQPENQPIIVTAQRREQNLQDVPISIAAAHQAGALVIITLTVWALFELRPEARDYAVRRGREREAAAVQGA